MLARSSPRTPRKEGVRCRWAGNNPGPSVEKVWRDVSIPSPYPLLRSSVHFNSMAPKFARIPKSLALSLVFCLGSYPTDPRAHPWLCFWHGIWWNLDLGFCAPTQTGDAGAAPLLWRDRAVLGDGLARECPWDGTRGVAEPQHCLGQSHLL